MFPWRLTERFLSALARRHDRLADALFLMSEMYQRAYKNLSYDMKINGEYWLLDRLRAIPARTIFDVGANHGLWSAAASLRFPRAEIHAFEIVPSTYRHLEAAVRDLKNVHPNPFGLFESNGSVEVSVSQNDTISSIFDLSAIGTNRQSQERISCTVRRADEYCLEHNISNIDLLKIDVEGAEHSVLNSFGDLWNQGRIGLVQFEYGIYNLYSRHFLIDFWNEFNSRGYSVGKLMPDHVAFSEYSYKFEDFIGPNYIAIHHSRQDLLRALDRRS